jgi:hypothetical protein
MNNAKIFLENGSQTDVKGIFYIFNSKYYFLYTLGELAENEYVQLYLVQVCKEVQNTEVGPVETGYMIGMETSDRDEWKKLQDSVTIIVDNKKNGTQNSEIQYLPIEMLNNLKIVSKNKIKLLKHLLDDVFKINVSNFQVNKVVDNSIFQDTNYGGTNITTKNSEGNQLDEEVIIDYRAKFFEEQEKNEELEEQIKKLNDKLKAVKEILN